MPSSRFRIAPVIALASILGCERHAAIPAVERSPNGHSRTARSLACLEPDSLRLHHDSVHYSTLRVHEETGDVVGIDLYLIRRDREWTATVALAEGGVTKPAPARTIALDSITGTLSLMWEHEGRVAEFRGRLSCQRLIGEFQWSPDAEHMLDTLPRFDPWSARSLKCVEGLLNCEAFAFTLMWPRCS